MLTAFLASLWEILLDLAPWLVVGLVAAGLIQALLPMRMVATWLGGRGVGAIVRAAILGAPLPLCSCSVLPAAVSLRKQGASRGAVASFLVSTPETGVDSIAVSYAMLGPFLTVARVISAVCSAIVVGLAVTLTREPSPRPGLSLAPKPSGGACCGSATCCDATPEAAPAKPLPRRIRDGLRYAATMLFDDLVVWLAVGVLAAAAIDAFAPPDLLTRYGSGLLPMLLMLVIGVPMYVCASASTPVGAAMLAAGVSPGTVLVFLLAGPATNVSTFGVIRRQLGSAAVAAYLAALAVTSLACGFAVDALATRLGYTAAAAATRSHEDLLPLWVTLPCLALLALLTLRWAWRRVRAMLPTPHVNAESTTAATADAAT